MSTDPEYRKRVIENEARIQTIIKEQESLKSGARVSGTLATLYTIPVVVHVMHTGGAIGTTYNPTDAQITGAIDYLNDVYDGTYAGTSGVGDIQIQFALATRDTLCNATTGIERINMSGNATYVSSGVFVNTSGVSETVVKNTSRWNPSSYYNIWVVNKIDGADGTSGQFIAGFAYLAGASPTLDGTIMLATQFVSGQKTLPHEIGHALSLYHPFEGSPDVTVCPANTDCSSDGDKVCDTDPISFNKTGGVVNFTPRSGTNTCTGTAYTASTENNYMNYTNVYNQFTSGQKTRMLAAMTIPSRGSLSTSWGLSGTYPTVSFTTPASACSVTSTSANGGVGLVGISIDTRSFSSGTSSQDGGYVDKTGNCTSLIYLDAGGTYTFSASVLGAFNEQVGAWLDYNNDGAFSASEQILTTVDDIASAGGTYPYPSVSQSFTIPVSAQTGTILRLRVIEEASTMYVNAVSVNSGCVHPFYGQAEDFPVYIAASTLPVMVNYFKGDMFGNVVRLSWKTSSENNTEIFDLERSYNGTDYTSISKTTASGNIIGSTYTYDDNTHTGTVMYYRLKQVDKNGTYKYSDVVTIKKETPLERTVIIRNNPFRENLSIGITTSEPSKVLVNMTDVTGKLIYTKTINTPVGSMIVEPETSNLGAGIYMIQVNINGKIVTKKVIKQ